jgi:hypothetical protein
MQLVKIYCLPSATRVTGSDDMTEDERVKAGERQLRTVNGVIMAYRVAHEDLQLEDDLYEAIEDGRVYILPRVDVASDDNDKAISWSVDASTRASFLDTLVRRLPDTAPHAAAMRAREKQTAAIATLKASGMTQAQIMALL